MTDDENLAFLNEVMAHSKAAAGLPQDWGRTATPLSADEDLEDGPRPARMRSGMTTADLLPYGPVQLAEDGDQLLERITCPSIYGPGGGIDVCDPVSLEWQGAPIAVDLPGSDHRVEIAVLRYPTPHGELLRPAVAVVGEVEAVTSWAEFPVPGTRMSIDKGCGAFIAREHVGAVTEIAPDLLSSVRAAALVPVTVGGQVVGALFASGDGPGGYEVMVGMRRGRPVALLIDLGVLPR